MLRLGVLLAAVTALGCAPRAGRSNGVVATAAAPFVLVVSLDGVSASALSDPWQPLPTLRRLAREGASAERMTTVNPTTTWANHATLMTGVGPARHGVLHNGAFTRPSPTHALEVQQDIVDLPLNAKGLSDLAHAGGLRTAGIGWLPPRAASDVDAQFPDLPRGDGALPQQLVKQGVITAQELAGLRDAPVTARDEVGVRVALHLMANGPPDVMFVHLLATDWLQHQEAPRSLAASAALALADARVGELLRGLESAGLSSRATVFVVSDHGFRRASRSVRPNVALRAAGLIRVEGTVVAAADVQAVSFGGVAMVYVADPARKTQLIPRTRAAVAGLEGVAQVIEPEGFAALGLPRPQEDDEAPDLLLVARPGFAFSSSAEGDAVVSVQPPIEPGYHGYLASDAEMDALFIAWGRGVRRGVRLPVVANVDVAPTAARVLGLTMPNVEGHVLTGALLP